VLREESEEGFRKGIALLERAVNLVTVSVFVVATNEGVSF
jgi:hypothetical protein